MYQGFRVRQEYPSVAEEALDGVGENAVYGSVFTRLRQMGRVGCRFMVGVCAGVGHVVKKHIYTERQACGYLKVSGSIVLRISENHEYVASANLGIVEDF